MTKTRQGQGETGAGGGWVGREMERQGPLKGSQGWLETA